MYASEYKTVLMPPDPVGGWVGHIRKTGWKYKLKAKTLEGVEFMIEPNSLLLVLECAKDDTFKVMLVGDDQKIVCSLSRLDFLIDTLPV